MVLHDIGKIHELSYERGFSYTSEGQLLGHMMIALRMVDEKLRVLPDFPPRLRALVEHMIISHHGQLEFGSPKVPQFPEAHAAALSGRHGFEDGMHARHAGEGPPGGRLLHRLQLGARPDGAEEGPVPRSPPPPAARASGNRPPRRWRPREPRPCRGASPAYPRQRPQSLPSRPSHPLFSGPPKSNSAFGDKLLQALQPVESKRED